jgi:hypothetical protein
MFLSLVFGRANSCTGKADYKSEATALKAKMNMERKRAPKKFEVYNCWWCGGWHIGGAVKGRLIRSFAGRMLSLPRLR